MASVIGKWKIDTVENFEEYMKAIGVSDEKREAAHKFLSTGSDMTQEFSCDGDAWTMTTCTAMGEKQVPFKLGVEQDSVTLDGRPIKVCTHSCNVVDMNKCTVMAEKQIPFKLGVEQDSVTLDGRPIKVHVNGYRDGRETGPFKLGVDQDSVTLDGRPIKVCTHSCNVVDMNKCTVVAEKKVPFKLDVEQDSVTLNGRPIKVVFTVDGDSLVETQTGDNFKCTHVRKGAGDKLTMSLTGNGVSCTRNFVKV